MPPNRWLQLCSIPPRSSSFRSASEPLHPEKVAAFSQAFRSAFQVPESMPSIAGLITEQRHRLWIEQYLGQLSGS